MTPSPSHPTIIGLRPGSLIQGWRVFQDAKLQPNPDDPPELAERRAALFDRYKGLTIDVRRLPRATARRYAQRVALAASGWDDVPQDPQGYEARVEATEAVERVTEELLRVFRELLLERVPVAGEGARALANIHGITVKLVGGETKPISSFNPEEQVEIVDELGLLDPVGRAALKAQDLEEYHFRL